MSEKINIGTYQCLEIKPDHGTGQIVVRRRHREDEFQIYDVQRYSPEQAENIAMAMRESLLELAVVDAEMSWKKACPVMQGFHPLGKVGAP